MAVAEIIKIWYRPGFEMNPFYCWCTRDGTTVDAAIRSWLRELSEKLPNTYSAALHAKYLEVICASPGNYKIAGATDAKDIVNSAKPSADDQVNHPAHYGGKDNPYEAVKVIEAWKLGFNLGNTVKYINRAPHKGSELEDLKKARWYLDREIQKVLERA